MSTTVVDPATEIHEVAIAEKTHQRNSLYHIAMDLQELLDSEEFPDEEHWAEFTAALGERGGRQVNKVQDVGEFYLALKQKVKACDEVIDRTRENRDYFQRILDRMDVSIEYVIKAVGKDIKDKWKKLLGRTVILSLKNNPGAVKILDKDLIAPKYKRHKITVWGDTWAQVLQALPADLRLKLTQEINERKFDTEISRTRIREDMLDKQLDVAGADIEYTQSVQVR